MEFRLKKANRCVRWCWSSFCIVFFCKKNLVRDAVILVSLVSVLTVILGSNFYLKKGKNFKFGVISATSQKGEILGQMVELEEKGKFPIAQAQESELARNLVDESKPIISQTPTSTPKSKSTLPKALPEPVVSKAKFAAPKPSAATKKDKLGRRVCAKKNDKPGKSSQSKKKHLDMECCLDPDEYPNPHCYYPPDKYGKYLEK